MRKISKFLMVGAIGLAVGVNAMAQTNQNNSEETVRLNNLAHHFLSEINPLILKQYQMGTLTERADVTVSINAGTSRELYDNYFYKKMGLCAVQVNFNENGDIPHLGVDGVINNLTVTKNPTQAKMARQFLALHEHNHCEFFNFKDPVIFFREQQKHTYVISGLKDLSKINMASSYMDTVNESYADVSASIALLIEYGINNQDAHQVLDAIKTQRQDNYIQKKMDAHFSHYAMEELLHPINLKRLSNFTQAYEVRDFALELANKGAAKTFYAKPQMKDATFHEKSLFASVTAEVGILEVSNRTPDKRLPVGYETLHKYNQVNLVTDLAKRVASEPEIQAKFRTVDNLAENIEPTLEYVYNFMNKHAYKYKAEVELYKQTMIELNAHIQYSVKNNIVQTSFVNEDYSANSISNNVLKLRKNYIAKNNININKPL